MRGTYDTLIGVHAPDPPSILVASGAWSPGSPCAVAVGNFDGVHLGHAAIIRRLIGLARSLGVPSAVLTFDPHPAAVIRPEAAPAPLSTPARRAELLARLGVDTVLVQPTDARLTSLTAKRFYADILRGTLHAAGIVEGCDFRFGAGRLGDVGLLAELCRADGIELAVVDHVAADGAAVSSSRIRGLIGSGDVAAANRLLTAPYRLEGTVVEGAKRGRALGFPTANLADVRTLVPAGGVYAGRAAIPGVAPHAAAIHIGPNVTFGETSPTVEVHLIGFDDSLYGLQLGVDFLARLRDTRRFDSVAELVSQLTEDAKRAADVAAG